MLPTTALPDVDAYGYEPGDGFPLFIEPSDASLRTDPAHVAEWFAANRPAIDRLSTEAGAIVFRNFPITETRHFGAMIDTYDTPQFGYTAGATPRGTIEGKVFEATQAPPEFRIPLHQEMAYLPTYPTRLAFYCKTPSTTGGETIVGDMRKFERSLSPTFRQQVKERGVLYQRNFRSLDWETGHAILDARHRPWMDAFDTTDPAVAEAACAEMGLTATWVDGTLTTGYRGPGIVEHPDTGEDVWFNQLIPQSIVVEVVGEELMSAYDHHYQNGRPRPYEHRYGDGGEIDIADISESILLLEEATIAFPWQAGDVLLLDNYHAGHGRNPFTGTRDIQVALLGQGGA